MNKYFLFLFSILLANHPFSLTAQNIQSVVPGSTPEGSSLTVTLSGQNTAFGQGTTTTQVWFNQGSTTLVPFTITVNSITNLEAQLNVPYGTPLGLYQSNVQNAIDGLISLPSSFEVTPGANPPSLLSVNPDSTVAGTVLPVLISGQNTHFSQGTGTVLFHQGSNTLTTLNTNALSLTDLEATIDVPSNANPGYYDLTVTNGLDGTMQLPFALFVAGGPCQSYNASITSNGCTGTPADIYIDGGVPPYQITINNQILYSQYQTFSWLPPDTGNFIIQSVHDLYGCAATIPDSIINHADFTASLDAESGCAGDTFHFNFTTQSSSPIVSAYFYYGNGSGGYLDNTIMTTAGSYLPQLTLYNQDGCMITVTADSTFSVYPQPALQIVSQIDATCGSNNGELGLSAIGNGPFTFAVAGPNSFSSSDTLLTALSPGTYQIDITDNNGCASNTVVLINNVVAGTPLQGLILDVGGNPVNNARIAIHSTNDSDGIMQEETYALTDANGQYNFNQLAEGSYILHVHPDTQLTPNYMPTWYGDVSLWNMADTIAITCSSSATANVTLSEEIPATGGGNMSGVLVNYNFGLMEGYPIFLQRISDGIFLDAKLTDANGSFAFTMIDPGDYMLWADIPGLIHTGNYTRSILGNTQFSNLYIMADTIMQTIDTLITVGIKNQKEQAMWDIAVYPNPFDAEVTLALNPHNNSPITIVITDLSGRLVNSTQLIPNGLGHSNYSLSLFNNPSGLYLMKVKQNNQIQRFRLIKK